MARIGLVAHDDKKDELVGWALKHKHKLSQHELWGTGTSGGRVTEGTGLAVTRLLSGPLGGDAQIGAMIARRDLEIVVFFWDPLSTQPHAADVQSLIRLAVLHGVAIACNRRTADLVISSPLLEVRQKVGERSDRDRL